MTHTYAILEVSGATYAEIRKLLADAGYEHAFNDDLVDMHGIAIRATDASAPESVHPSHLPTVIDVLEDEIRLLRDALTHLWNKWSEAEGSNQPWSAVFGERWNYDTDRDEPNASPEIQDVIQQVTGAKPR